MGSEFSLKTAVVSLFVEGVLEIEGDEKGEWPGKGRKTGVHAGCFMETACGY